MISNSEITNDEKDRFKVLYAGGLVSLVSIVLAFVSQHISNGIIFIVFLMLVPVLSELLKLAVEILSKRNKAIQISGKPTSSYDFFDILPTLIAVFGSLASLVFLLAQTF